MNNFNLCGRVVNVGQKRADRAPWPVEIETEIGRDKTVIVPVEIFRPEPPPVGWIAAAAALFRSRPAAAPEQSAADAAGKPAADAAGKPAAGR